jgi:hypothetical protein
MIVYVIKCKPFKSELQQVVASSDEFTIVFGMIALYIMWRNENNPAALKKIGWLIIGIIVRSI